MMAESLRWQINMFTYLFYMDWDKSFWSHSWLPDDVPLLSLLLSVPQNLSLVCLVCMWTAFDSDTGKPIILDLHQLQTLRAPLKESVLQLFRSFFCSSVILDACSSPPGARSTSARLKMMMPLLHQQMWNQHRRRETQRVWSPNRSPNNQSHKLQKPQPQPPRIRWNSSNHGHRASCILIGWRFLKYHAHYLILKGQSWYSL